MIDFDIACDYVLENEGGFCDNKNDRGGMTNHGISLRFFESLSKDKLNKCGFFLKKSDSETIIKNLTITDAKKIYFETFWSEFDYQNAYTQNVANYLFDCAVNCGTKQTIKFLQRALSSLFCEILIDDGIFGDITQNYLRKIRIRYNDLLYSLRSERAGFYRLLAEKNNQQIFLDGWLMRAYECL